MTTLVNPSFAGQNVNKILKNTAQTLYDNDAAILASKLDQFATTSSAELASVISDETGTGLLVFNDSPALGGTPTAPTQSPLDNSTKIATTAYTDAAVAVAASGADHSRGGWDASVGLYPATGGTGIAGAVKNGDYWHISVAGTIGGEVLEVGDQIIAIVDAPGQTATNWLEVQRNIDGAVVGPVSSVDNDFAMFDGVTGKIIKDGGLSLSIDGTMASNSDSLIPSQKASVTYVGAEIAKAEIAVSTGAVLSTAVGTTLTIVQTINEGVFITATAAAQTFSLPAMIAANDGLVLTVVNAGATNAFTLDSVDAYNIGGVATQTMNVGDLIKVRYVHASTQFIMIG